MGKLSITLLATLTGVALANDAKPKTAALASTTSPAEAAIPPSRFVDDQKQEQYIKQMAASLSSSKRSLDPFAQLQDPELKPATQNNPTRIARRFTPASATPLSEVVSKLNVTMVMPKSKQFILNGRNLGVGDKLVLNYKGNRINTVITEINSNQISFKNEDNGEVGILKFNGLPKGFTRGTGSIKMPGTPANAPLEIDASENQPNNP